MLISDTHDFLVDGKVVPSGTPFDAPETQAKRILAGGRARVHEGGDQLAEFAEAVEALDPENESQWTKDGRPDLKALGLDIDGKTRDELWAEYQG